MHVSTHMLYVAGATSRVQPRKPDADGGNRWEIRRVFENASEGRRQQNSPRRPRPNMARPRDTEDRASDSRLAAMRPAAQAEAQPFTATPKTAEFWTLLGAVAPDTNVIDSSDRFAQGPREQKPSLHELLAQVIASH